MIRREDTGIRGKPGKRFAVALLVFHALLALPILGLLPSALCEDCEIEWKSPHGTLDAGGIPIDWDFKQHGFYRQRMIIAGTGPVLHGIQYGLRIGNRAYCVTWWPTDIPHFQTHERRSPAG
jgi:hypothetical protein